MKALSAKEALFCEYYKILGSAREAAARAGYSFPERTGLRLLKKGAVRAALSGITLPLPEAVEGLRRIAFGSVCDAVYLCKNDPLSREQLEGLDLYCVSELKFTKGGGIEVKFFDRLKALDMLSSLSAENTPSAEPFYLALSQGARALGGDKDGV